MAVVFGYPMRKIYFIGTSIVFDRLAINLLFMRLTLIFFIMFILAIEFNRHIGNPSLIEFLIDGHLMLA
jgi:hypothetical protein